MPVLLTFKIQDAVCKSTLDRDTKHLLMVMALLAGGSTGVGTSGQATIARAMGCTDRHVRKLLANLDANPGSPIKVVRKRRGSALGRTSDEYTLILSQPERCAGSDTPSQPEQHSASGTEANRNGVPLDGQTQPERHDKPTGTPRQPKRNVRSEDQRSDQRSDQRRSSASAKPKRGKAADKPPVPGAHDLKLHYIAEFRRRQGVEPNFGKAWSRAMGCFGEMVTTHGLEVSKRIVTVALADAYVRKINPWELRDDANKYRGEQPVRGKPPVSAQRGVADEKLAQEWGKDGAAKLLGGSP